MDYLTFEITDKEENCFALSCRNSIRGFSGYGEAWFNYSQIKLFIEDLLHLSELMDTKADLIGGQNKYR